MKLSGKGNNKIVMEFENLFENFLGFMLKNNMIANITYHIFDNFPNNIPDQIINNFEQFIDEFPEKKGTLDIYAKKAKKIKEEIISGVNETDEADTIEIKKIGQALDEMPTFWRILTTGLLFLCYFGSSYFYS